MTVDTHTDCPWSPRAYLTIVWTINIMYYNPLSRGESNFPPTSFLVNHLIVLMLFADYHYGLILKFEFVQHCEISSDLTSVVVIRQNRLLKKGKLKEIKCKNIKRAWAHGLKHLMVRTAEIQLGSFYNKWIVWAEQYVIAGGCDSSG